MSISDIIGKKEYKHLKKVAIVPRCMKWGSVSYGISRKGKRLITPEGVRIHGWYAAVSCRKCLRTIPARHTAHGIYHCIGPWRSLDCKEIVKRRRAREAHANAVRALLRYYATLKGLRKVLEKVHHGMLRCPFFYETIKSFL